MTAGTHAESLDSLSEAMWSEVSAQWDALAPLASPRAPRPPDRLPSPIRVDTPFAASPDLRFLYHSAEHDRALSELVSSVTRGEAVLVLTGERGAGKTTVSRSLVDHLDRRTMVSFVTAATSVDDLLKRLLVDFGVISSDETARQLTSASRDDLSRALREFFSSLTTLQATALVIVDDAHVLTPEVWTEVAAIVGADADHRLQLLLVGEPALRRLMRRADVRALERRVAFRVELGSLRREEIHAYVPHRLAVAGMADQVRFDESALRHVFSVSGGVPGVVNSICDRALTLAVLAADNRIDAALVAQAAEEIGVQAQLGSGWRDRTIVALFLIVMLIAGAVGASWMFRETLNRAIARWHGGDRPTSSTTR